MDISSDFEDLFKVFNANKVKYIVVGAYAVIYYTQPRYTKDIDVWVPSELNDEDNVYQSLKEFGAPLTGLTPEDFNDQSLIYQIGVAPVRIDIIVNLKNMSVQVAWKNKKRTWYGHTPIHVLGINELIYNKRMCGRNHDKIDLEKLLKAKSRNKT